MKTTFFSILFIFSSFYLNAQFQFDENQLLAPEKYGAQIANSFDIIEVHEFVSDDFEHKVFLKNGLRSAQFLHPEYWTAISNEVEVEKIKIVFSKYPIRKNGYSMSYPLLCNRLKNLFELDPFLNDVAIQWEIVLQTNCVNDEQVNQLFHGIVIEYKSPIIEEFLVEIPEEDTMDVVVEEVEEIDTFDVLDDIDDLPEELKQGWAEKSEDEKTAVLIDHYEKTLSDTTTIKVTPQLLEKQESTVDKFIKRYNYSPSRDSTVLKVFERNKDWKKILVVSDWTGSMYQYGAEASLWHILNFEQSGMEYLTLFNDGDRKPTFEKAIGETEGVYFQEANDIDKLIDLYNLVMLKGGGGDTPENDLEAIIKGIEKYPDHVDIVLIADNDSCVRDMKLLKKISKPVRVILCGYNKKKGANPQYVKIAQKTGGSLHTVEADIYNLAMKGSKRKGVKLIEEKIRIGKLPCLNQKRFFSFTDFGYKLTDTIYTNVSHAKKDRRHNVYLDLSNQQLKKIPKRINRVTMLKNLDLSKNKIAKISGSVYFSRSVVNVNLAHNQIDRIPVEIERMIQLISLDLSHNKLDSLVTSFYRLKKLKYLNLSDNSIRHLPKNFNARYLQELYLDNNQLKELPSSISRLKNIKMFSARNNKLKEVSKKISYMKKLETLDLSDNDLTTLPPTIGRLKKLKRLILSGNYFSKEELKKLHRLLPNTEIEYQ